jgi:membrane protein implicated in regulation of membrane protease activity
LIARYYALSHPLAALVGIATGTLFAAAAYQFGKLLYRQQASSELRMADLVGQTAEVVVSIPAGGVGQIALTFGGQHTTHLARAADGVPIPSGAEVRITALRGDSVVVRSNTPAAGGE